jgi:hypothetical protein
MNRQHLEIHAGENRTLTLYARTSANAVKNLASHTLSWRFGRGPFWYDTDSSVITKAGSIVSAALGTFSVSLGVTDTQYLSGDFEHYATATDASGNVSAVVGGRFRILPQIQV